jgi:hypothetical protein
LQGKINWIAADRPWFGSAERLRGHVGSAALTTPSDIGNTPSARHFRRLKAHRAGVDVTNFMVIIAKKMLVCEK